MYAEGVIMGLNNQLNIQCMMSSTEEYINIRVMRSRPHFSASKASYMSMLQMKRSFENAIELFKKRFCRIVGNVFWGDAELLNGAPN